MAHFDDEFSSGRHRLRTTIAAVSVTVFAVMMYVLVQASLDPRAPVSGSPHTTVLPSSTHLPIPTVPPLRIPPEEPR